MKQLVNIILLLWAISGCKGLTNHVNPESLECGVDFIANDRPWFRVETSEGTLLNGNEFEALVLADGSWKLLEISSKGCVNPPVQQEWIIRSMIHKESRLVTLSNPAELNSHRLRLEQHTGENLKLACPSKPVNQKNLTFEQIFRLEDPGSTRFGVDYELYEGNSEISIFQNAWLLGSQSLPLVPGPLVDGVYHLKFKIQDLRQDQSRDHECKIQLDNTPPNVELDRSHLLSEKVDDHDYFVIPRQEQLRFKTQNPFHDVANVEYCFLPFSQDGDLVSSSCGPANAKTVTIGEPISPSLNIGMWELHFRAVDSAENQAQWQRVAPIVYADSVTMQQIQLESRSDMIQTEVAKVNGIFDVLFKAFSNYSLWKNLNTEFEKSKTLDAIISLFYAAHIGMNNYSQFISATDKTNNMIISPDGERLFVGVYNGDTEIYDLRSKKLLSTLKGHWASAAAFSLSPDNKILVTGNFDLSIKVWDLDRNQLVSTIACCEGSFLRVAISPDKKSIVSSSWNRIVKIWSLDGTLQKSISLETEPNFHDDV